MEKSPGGRPPALDARCAKNLLSGCFTEKQIAHGVAPHRLRRKPERGRKSSPGKDRPIGGPMSQNELFPGPGELHGVLAHNLPFALR